MLPRALGCPEVRVDIKDQNYNIEELLYIVKIYIPIFALLTKLQPT